MHFRRKIKSMMVRKTLGDVRMMSISALIWLKAEAAINEKRM